MVPEDTIKVVGLIYILTGSIGFFFNAITIGMIVSERVYRLSAYTVMANLALADAIMMMVAGVVCGSQIVSQSLSQNSSSFPFELLLRPAERPVPLLASNSLKESTDELFSINGITETLNISSYSDASFSLTYVVSFVEIAAWTAGICSYAFLGLNRCIAICFYRTKAKSLNRVSMAIVFSTITWLIGCITAFIGTLPEPLIGFRSDMWSISFLNTFTRRSTLFIMIASILNVMSVAVQWLCSAMVIHKILVVRQKISRKKLNVNSANRFKKQARISFQFLYPSLICTVSSIIYFIKPFLTEVLVTWQFVSLHMIWLVNHMCNPFIYAYFNERMRNSYGNWLTCSKMRLLLRKQKFGLFDSYKRRLNVGSRQKYGVENKLSMRSTKIPENNFVRSSLQMQSRDFEQLCEFMMRVNPMNFSSEGWTESSEDEDEQHGIEENVLSLSTSAVITSNGRNTSNKWKFPARIPV